MRHVWHYHRAIWRYVCERFCKISILKRSHYVLPLGDFTKPMLSLWIFVVSHNYLETLRYAYVSRVFKGNNALHHNKACNYFIFPFDDSSFSVMGMMRLAVIEVLLHSSRQLHLQIWSSSCTMQMGAGRHLLVPARTCKNHKRWGHWSLSNQYPLCPVFHFLSPTLFQRDYWPTSFPFLLCCVTCQCRGCVPDGGHHCGLL